MGVTGFSRRAALAGLGAGALCAATSAWAKAPLVGVLRPQVYRVKLGGFEAVTVLDGVVQRPDPHSIFGQDQKKSTVAALLRENFLPETALENGYAPVLVNTGESLILFDAGNGTERRPDTGRLVERLALAGYAPSDVDIVVLTHFHPDHIGGLMEAGLPVFPNARYVAGRKEYDFWARPDSPERSRKLFQSKVAPLAERTTMIEDGQDVVAGVTAMAAFGHSPGHMAYHIESKGRRLLIAGDTANHYVLSLQRPDWVVKFDMDKEAAAATRKKVFDMVAAEKIPFTGYHMPFPSIGYVEKAEPGYRYVPASYQLHL